MSLVGNLLYLSIARLDVMFTVSLFFMLLNPPSHFHLGVAKRVFISFKALRSVESDLTKFLS